ncbi:hypothetical protein K227x_17050 [Rubripirellula lacrimiformis]|uniref:Uncharacterized protein n=2 Tax=Rubripirellula lacrimiformis TaxID=1930273 RepID=A0A517N857_9BACT|nr:hypothetical protein K227x_17050 [Rubripirellula lacrimiformis]
MLWDRSVLTQLGFGIHLLVLVVYCVATVDSDRSPTSMMAGIDPWLHIAMGVCSVVGFVLVFAMTITRTAWPLHQRACLVGMDLVLIGFAAFISQGFGALIQ